MTSIGKILIVDDEKSNTEIIKDMLEDVNYVVHTASCADEAKQILATTSFDLIMLDVWMPGQDGMSLLKELKKDYVNTKIVMMSGHAEHYDIVEAIKLGAVDFIKKPMDNILPLVRKITNSKNTHSNHIEHSILDQPLKLARIEFETQYFNYHLKHNNNNVSKVAKISAIERTTLYRKLKELGIDKK